MSIKAPSTRGWRPPPLISDPRLRWLIIIGVVVYLYFALSSVNINVERLIRGLDRGSRMFAGFLQPDFTTRWRDIQAGLIESLTMTVVSTVIGIIISIPIGFGAARNMAPMPIYLFCRGLITISRTFQEVIIAIVFVVMFGFGPLAGVLTLSFATIGFLAKLLAEDIEEIDAAQVEATRTTGASWLQTVTYGVLPQVSPRLVGLSIYRFDINLRESAIVGVVGAGGIGATLQTAFTRYDFDIASAILIIIIVLVMITELISSYIRRRLQ
ncbi:phosphonate ABC transporter, permease protein PhnE [Candidatus Chloroploca sp. M-50]|uniref:Phosphonate ABC transporter, permease protein PhnE n=1 Tax=Candidatus Chloroploca mongolica TaxID=2528176 RepID=A0ABS4DA56_9CHLR|nr:phosphonate ABC transporter, permease protein PhnE [Candidatus Chloroploca mongolica]MBP1466312.1 phosphonate ABC transporter, permease protein PhnE [Candidatus Chloroploca mongolica]